MATSCTFEDFFFKATGNRPYPYQKSLAISFAFPPLLDIPTGLGKTAAVTIGWLWRRYIGEGVTDKPAAQVRDETPRRLIYCLPMRVLVEQTKANAGQWVKGLFTWVNHPQDIVVYL
jgi:CRISPR-associated endonuclease/helicase Cas3